MLKNQVRSKLKLTFRIFPLEGIVHESSPVLLYMTLLPLYRNKALTSCDTICYSVDQPEDQGSGMLPVVHAHEFSRIGRVQYHPMLLV